MVWVVGDAEGAMRRGMKNLGRTRASVAETHQPAIRHAPATVGQAARPHVPCNAYVRGLPPVPAAGRHVRPATLSDSAGASCGRRVTPGDGRSERSLAATAVDSSNVDFTAPQ